MEAFVESTVRALSESHKIHSHNLPLLADAVQLKTFTRWWNSWLAPRGTDVTELCEQIKSGVLGIQLMEALSGAIIPRYNRNPRTKRRRLQQFADIGPRSSRERHGYA